MIRIKKEDYSSLKELFVTDPEALKYKFPIRVISENTDTTLNIEMIEYPSSYILIKQRWLIDVLVTHLKNEKNRKNDGFWVNIIKGIKGYFNIFKK